MKYFTFATAVAVLALTACGQAQESTREASTQSGVESRDAGQTYTGAGKATAIAGDRVSIEHGPIEGIGWPAMTMSFTAPAGVVEGVEAGSDVAFAFKQQGSAYVLTSLQKR